MENVPLNQISGPDKVEILPNLFVEDKLRIKTQRRLEKHFKIPIRRLFKGQWENPVTKQMEFWNGVDFEFLDNLVPLLTILGQQVNDILKESEVEDALDNIDPEEFGKKLGTYFTMLAGSRDDVENPTKVQPEIPTGD